MSENQEGQVLTGKKKSVAWADGLVVIPEGQVLKRGDPVKFIPFSELLG